MFLTTKKIQLIENSAVTLYPQLTSQLDYNAYWFILPVLFLKSGWDDWKD